MNGDRHMKTSTMEKAMSQNFTHSYKDPFLEFTVEAQNDEHTHGNVHDLVEAILKVMECTSEWKKFELYVVVKAQKTSQDDWQQDPDLA